MVLSFRQKKTMTKTFHTPTASEFGMVRMLLDSSREGAILSDARGIVTQVNPKAEEIFGYSREAFIGLSIEDLLQGEFAQNHSHLRKKYIHNPHQRAMQANRELLAKRKDGSTVMVSVHLYPFQVGEELMVMSFVSDLSEHHNTRERLRESEEKYRVLFESASEGIIIVDRTGRIEMINNKTEGLFGYSRDELLGSRIEKLIPRNLRSHHQKIREGYTGAPQARAMGQGRDLTGLHKDGSEFPIEVSLSPVKIGGELYIMSFIIDITARKLAEEARRKSETENVALLEAIPDMMMRFNRQGRLLNFKCPEHFSPHITKEQDIGKRISEIFSPRLTALFQKHIDTLLQKGRVQLFEFTLDHGTEEKHHLEARLVLAREEILAIIRDITEPRSFQDLAEVRQQQLIQADKMATLGTLVSGVAHEVNNPNNYIQLNASIILEVWRSIQPILEEYQEHNGDFPVAGMPFSKAQEKIGKLIEGIKDGSVRIQKIVESLKNFARQDGGEFDSDCDVAGLIESALTITHNVIKRSTNHFSIMLPDHLPSVPGNRQQLEQVVINLITNACQALPSTDKHLEISAKLAADQQHVLIMVRDEGTGILPENMKHIFDPFFTTKRTSGGTGLGLSISYNIIQRHKGNLRLESTPGKGTLVTIELPVYSLLPDKKDSDG